jgi:O-antigen/teichoic acid export membrane protein
MTETTPEIPDGTGAGPSLARRTGVGMMWAQASKVIELALSFGIAILAVRALHPDRFGAYSLLTNLAGAASVFLPVVTVDSLGAVLPRLPRREERLFLLVLVAALRAALIAGASAVVVAAWPGIAAHVGLGGVPRTVVLVAAGYWLAQDMLNTLAAYHGTAIDMRPVVVWRGLGLAATLAALAGVVSAGAVSVATVLGVVAGGSGIAAAGLAFGLRRQGAPRSPGREQVRFALGLTRHTWLIGLLSFALATQIDILLIGGLTHDKRQAAFYAVAVGVVGRAQYLLVSGWSSLIIPAFGHALVEGGDRALRRAWHASAQLWLLVSVSISALLLANAVPLVRVVFGHDYAPAGGLLQWVSIFNLSAAFLVNPPSIGAVWVYDRQRTLARLRILSGGLNIALAVPLIEAYGALGAVVATGVAAVVGGALELEFARRIGSTSYPGPFAAIVAIAAGAAMLPALLIHSGGPGGLAARFIAGALLFVGVLAVSRPFRTADVDAATAVHPWLGRMIMRLFARR